jgi:hypothetical protein
MKILNYTGKPIGLTNQLGSPYKVLPSVGKARFERVEMDEFIKIDGVPIIHKDFGKVLGLPKPDPNREKYYLVPMDIAQRIKNHRFDLLVAEDEFYWEGTMFFKTVISVS